MQKNYESCGNSFKCKVIGEGIFMSGRSVSGAMRKLLSEEFVEKTGNDPVLYSLTEKGISKDLT
jgi:predicted transcriptional regulator